MVSQHKNFERRDVIKLDIRLSLIPLLFLGCGHFSTNQISQGTFSLNNGYFHGQFLKSNLVFKRFSWFKEATLVYDVRMASRIEGVRLFSMVLSRVSKRCKGLFSILYCPFLCKVGPLRFSPTGAQSTRVARSRNPGDL